MKIYTLLSTIPAIKEKFTLKILFVAFVGIHIPLFAIIGYLVVSTLDNEGAWTIGLLTLGFTFLATVLTLIVLNSLLKPVMQAKNALNDYIRFAKIPNLPTDYQDEAGVLMRDIQKAINTLEEFEERRLSSLQLLSHDLQSPLRTTLGILDFVKEEKDPEFIREHHQLIEESLQSQLSDLEELLRELKNSRKSSLEKVEIKQLNLNDFLQAVKKRFAPSLEQKDLKLQIENTIEEVMLPKSVLQKCVTNVLSNAIKYSPEAGEIKLSTNNSKGFLNIVVNDEGVGFAPEDTAKIFQYDMSLRKLSDAKKEHSNGVGLHLCQTLLNKAGGEITAHSEGLGKGATFSIKVPIGVLRNYNPVEA